MNDQTILPQSPRKLTVDEFVGKQIDALLAKSAKSEYDLAKALSVYPAEIGNYIRGEKRLSAQQLFFLAHHFGVPVATFFGIDLEAA